MLQDQYGCALSTSNPEVVEYVNAFACELLRLGKKMDCILEGAKKFPDDVMLNILAAVFYLYGQTFETQELAKLHLEKASKWLEHANQREQSLYAFAQNWKNLELSNALKQIERHCFKWPKDLTAIKIAEFLFYCKGQKYESKRFLRLTNHCYSAHKNDPFFLSIHSFALELNEKYDESLQMAQQALQLNELNPWAHHTLSHIYLRRGLIEEGIELLERYALSWNQYSHIIESHNLWHLALLYFENLDFDKIQQVYKRADWHHQSCLVSEEIDITALLWRLDFEDQEGLTSPLWKNLAHSIEDHAKFGGMPFLSAQLCYALHRGQQEKQLSEALVQIEEFAHEQEKEDRFVWKDVGLPLIYGSLAFANKQYETALKHFDPIMGKVACVGGSDAQIDLFYLTYLQSLIGDKRFEEAQNHLLRATQGRNLTKLEQKWLAECR